VSAIAVVSGSIAIGHCRPPNSVSLLAIQGTDDDEVPFDDDLPDSLDDPGQSWMKAATPSVRYWSGLEGCTSTQQARVSPHVERIDFNGCHDSNVELYTIAGGIHGWPDADVAAGVAQPAEAAMHELPASETIAGFLLQHRR
jgi:poly(3-hydroxybutyrate) depolymerase